MIEIEKLEGGPESVCVYAFGRCARASLLSSESVCACVCDWQVTSARAQKKTKWLQVGISEQRARGLKFTSAVNSNCAGGGATNPPPAPPLLVVCRFVSARPPPPNNNNKWPWDKLVFISLNALSIASSHFSLLERVSMCTTCTTTTTTICLS